MLDHHRLDLFAPLPRVRESERSARRPRALGGSGLPIETAAGRRLPRVANPELRLAPDIGHRVVTQGMEPADAVRHYVPRIGRVAPEDAKRGVRFRPRFGAGDIDAAGAPRALAEVGVAGFVRVEPPCKNPRAHRAVVCLLEPER